MPDQSFSNNSDYELCIRIIRIMDELQERNPNDRNLKKCEYNFQGFALLKTIEDSVRHSTTFPKEISHGKNN